MPWTNVNQVLQRYTLSIGHTESDQANDGYIPQVTSFVIGLDSGSCLAISIKSVYFNKCWTISTKNKFIALNIIIILVFGKIS